MEQFINVDWESLDDPKDTRPQGIPLEPTPLRRVPNNFFPHYYPHFSYRSISTDYPKNIQQNPIQTKPNKV